MLSCRGVKLVVGPVEGKVQGEVEGRYPVGSPEGNNPEKGRVGDRTQVARVRVLQLTNPPRGAALARNH